jgi:hypothetical protein
MKRLEITCLIAYSTPEHEKNVIGLIKFLSHLNKKIQNKFNITKFVQINIYVGWNRILGLNKIFEYEKKLQKNVTLSFIEITNEYKTSTKAYFTWGHLLTKINLNADLYYFFKDNYFERIKLQYLDSIFHESIIKGEYDVLFQECVKNTNDGFHLKKIAYQHKDQFILFPRTQIFSMNKKSLFFLLYKNFFFSPSYQKKHRQYDLIKVLLLKFKIFTLQLRICDDEGDKHTVKIEKNIDINKITSN